MLQVPKVPVHLAVFPVLGSARRCFPAREYAAVHCYHHLHLRLLEGMALVLQQVAGPVRTTFTSGVLTCHSVV
jgi:hypothetical protein